MTNYYLGLKFFLLLCLMLLSSYISHVVSIPIIRDSQILLQVKDYQLDDPNGKLDNWIMSSDRSPCHWSGITCDSQNKSVIAVDLSGFGLTGEFPSGFCRINTLQNLTLNDNALTGTIDSRLFSLCSNLKVLRLFRAGFTGELPDFSSEFNRLEILDLSSNNFSGDIPTSFGRFPVLKVLSLGNNWLNCSIPWFLGNLSELTRLELSYNSFQPGPLPSSIGNLTKLKLLRLANSNLMGKIPDTIENLVSLVNLDLSCNSLTGELPTGIGKLKDVEQIELYQNQLSGELPESIGNLKRLVRFDASQNNLTGELPEKIAALPLQSLNLNDNYFTGKIPEILASNRNLYQLKLSNNGFTGRLPENLGRFSDLEFFDVSTNGFSGTFPRFLCHGNKLQRIVAFNNQFSGKLAESYGDCKSLNYVRISNNELSGEIPGSFWGLPDLKFLEMFNNKFEGPISPSISGARNLRTLVIYGNYFTGQIPIEICQIHHLNVVDLSRNKLSDTLPSCITNLKSLQKLELQSNMLEGEIPSSVSSWTELTELNLANNRLSSHIPSQLGDLPVLTYLDLSGNLLTGKIPSQLAKLNFNQFNVSNNQLFGELPYVFDHESFVSSFEGNPGLCSSHLTAFRRCPPSKRKVLYTVAIAIATACVLFLLGSIIWFKIFKSGKPKRSCRVKTFQPIDFTVEDIFPHLIDANVIGSGRSGKVYKVQLRTGQTIAVKKLWCGEQMMDSNSSFISEVQTLCRSRHCNVVKLLMCCSSEECRILVYEYMENGSLGDVLHGGGHLELNWPMRFDIAIGVAQGLEYMHHDCVPGIVHRAVKSNNVLLDGEMRPRLADFGLAKILQQEIGDMLCVVGPYGYTAPEYAYTRNMNEKSDVYSFGVLLLEIITGKRPNDPIFGEKKDVVKYVAHVVLSNFTSRKGNDPKSRQRLRDLNNLVDPKMNVSLEDYGEIEKVLSVALLCTSAFPVTRPSMRKVAELLIDNRSSQRN